MGLKEATVKQWSARGKWMDACRPQIPLPPTMRPVDPVTTVSPAPAQRVTSPVTSPKKGVTSPKNSVTTPGFLTKSVTKLTPANRVNNTVTTVTGYTKPADVLARQLAEDSRATRLSLSIAAKRLAQQAEVAQLEDSQNVKAAAQVASMVHGWDREEQRKVTVNIWGAGNSGDVQQADAFEVEAEVSPIPEDDDSL